MASAACRGEGSSGCQSAAGVIVDPPVLEVGDLEEIASELLTATCCARPVDALRLAGLCGLDVRHGRPERLQHDEGIIYVDARARPERLQGTVAHELGHFALARAGEDDCERGARYLAAALLMPLDEARRDVRELGPLELLELKKRYPNVSYEMVARRVADVRDAVVSILDHGRVRARIASPWLPRPSRELDDLEALVAEGALEREHAVRAADVAAVPVINGRWRRVVVVRALP